MSKIFAIRGCRAILNIHEREVPGPLHRAGALLDTLASERDQLWPGERWPPMRLDRGLAEGSGGGHSLIRYHVSGHLAGRRAEFTFDAMPHLPAFHGRHYFEAVEQNGAVYLRHIIDVRTDIRTWLYWKIFIERIHDALVEDAFDKAETNLGAAPRKPARWSLYVRALRWWRRRAARHS